VAATKRILAVKKSNLSIQTRKKISAKDTRTSATLVGGVIGLGAITVVILGIVISDIPLIVEHIKYGPHKGRQKGNKTNAW
jgi:hypothetical protein